MAAGINFTAFWSGSQLLLIYLHPVAALSRAAKFVFNGCALGLFRHLPDTFRTQADPIVLCGHAHCYQPFELSLNRSNVSRALGNKVYWVFPPARFPHSRRCFRLAFVGLCSAYSFFEFCQDYHRSDVLSRKKRCSKHLFLNSYNNNYLQVVNFS